MVSAQARREQVHYAIGRGLSQRRAWAMRHGDSSRALRSTAISGLEVRVHIEVHVAISFGLEVFASVFGCIVTFGEVFMENSFAIFAKLMACVWCGMAFLRSSGRENSNPNEGSRARTYGNSPRVSVGGSIPPLRTKFPIWLAMPANRSIDAAEE